MNNDDLFEKMRKIGKERKTSSLNKRGEDKFLEKLREKEQENTHETSYKGFKIKARKKDGVFNAKVELDALILTEGTTKKEIEQDFKNVIDDYLNDLNKGLVK